MFNTGQTVGPYKLERPLGRGLFAEVWLAVRQGALINGPVTIKLPLDPDPDPDAIHRKSQMWLMANGHPNVLPVIEVDVYDGQVAIVSEYCAGESLASWLDRYGGKAPSEFEAVSIIKGILDGLSYLHGLHAPINHGNLKPNNVILQRGIPRLTDFGDFRVNWTPSQVRSASGMPRYMSPEAFTGVCSPGSDVWAAGVILYEMLSGRLPFPQSDFSALCSAIQIGAPAPLSNEVRDPVKKALKCALDKDPGRRPRSARAFCKQLDPESLLLPIIVGTPHS